MSQAEYRRIILGYQGAVRQVRARLKRFALATWGAMGSYRDQDIDAMVARIVPAVLAGQRRIATLTDSYLTSVRAEILGGTARSAALSMAEVTGAAVRGGVPPDVVYRRPGTTVYTALADGTSFPEAREAGERRLVGAAMTDLQLAKTHTARLSMSRDKRVAGYRRILTGAENCALCVIASTQRYTTGQLSPIHPGCDCDVAEIYGDFDPGQVLDADALDAAHKQVEALAGTADHGGRAPDYRDIMIREHGEYGPTLTWRSQNFTGPADL